VTSIKKAAFSDSLAEQRWKMRIDDKSSFTAFFSLAK
jgi:hypothetical protein